MRDTTLYLYVVRWQNQTRNIDERQCNEFEEKSLNKIVCFVDRYSCLGP